MTSGSPSADDPHGRDFGILPAAGTSRRMGKPKLLLPWSSSTVIEAVFEQWLASRVTRLVCVIRADDSKLLKVCQRYDLDTLAVEPAPAQMKDSVRIALTHIQRAYDPRPGDGWLLAPADTPTLTTTAIDQVLVARNGQESGILVPRQNGRRGHPVWFPWDLAGEVARLEPDAGVNQLLESHDCTYLDVDDAGILDDFDTPEQYDRLRRRAARRDGH